MRLGDEKGALRGLLDTSSEGGPKGVGQLGGTFSNSFDRKSEVSNLKSAIGSGRLL